MENQASETQAVQESLPAENTTSEVVNTQTQANGVDTTPTPKSYSRQDIDGIMTKRLAKTYGAFHQLCNAPEEVRANRTTFANWLKKELETGRNATGKVTELNGRISTLEGDLFNARKELAFLHNNIDPAKFEDISLYFKGKGVNFTEELLKQELATHPDWLKKEQPKTTIQNIGNPKINIETNKVDEMKKKYFG